MNAQIRTERIVKPLGGSSTKLYLVLAAAGAGLVWFLYAWSYQLRYGMITTGLADWGSGGGVPLGMYIGSFIWWVGIAHGGIIISAAVRLLKLRALKPVTRLAELLTVIALCIAALFIIVHLGRPDRVVTSIIMAYPWTVFSSPLVWDVTVITLYFVMTTTYLLLTVRRDLYDLRTRLPASLAPLYRLLLVGYRPEEDEKVERMAWWLALGLIILAPLLLHGGVIPWLFALLPSMPGWYGAMQGPTFLSIALTSALGSVILVASIFRRVYGWKEVIPDRVFFWLGGALAVFALLFLWLQLQQIITGVYAPPMGVEKSTEAKLESPVYWLSIGLMAAAVVYLGAQTLFPSLFSLRRTVIAGLMPVLATLLEKVLFVVEGLMWPAFRLYQGVPGTYWPSWVEVSSFVGAISLALILFIVVSRVIPVIEVKAEEEG